MTLYEINNELEECSFIDQETGEVGIEKFNQLNIAFDEKIENTACFIKNLLADAAAIKAEEKALAERREAKENRAESLKRLLANVLQGQKKQYARAEISYRTSKAVEIDDEFVKWAEENAKDYLSYKDPTPNKTIIKQAILDGNKVQFARIEERQNIQVR